MEAKNNQQLNSLPRTSRCLPNLLFAQQHSQRLHEIKSASNTVVLGSKGGHCWEHCVRPFITEPGSDLLPELGLIAGRRQFLAEKSTFVKVLLNKSGQMYLRIASGKIEGKQNTLVGVHGIGIEVFFVTDEELERQFSSEAEIDPALAARSLLRIGTRSKITSEARESLEWIAA